LYNKAVESGVNICGVAKTNTLVTDSGRSISSALKRISPSGKWFYHPVCEINSEDHNAEMFFVRLNELSEYIFRLEIFKGMSFDFNEIISQLAENSRDYSFPGYPYGLIEAHRNALISLHEKEYHLAKIRLLLGREFERINDDISSINSHDILDSLQ